MSALEVQGTTANERHDPEEGGIFSTSPQAADGKEDSAILVAV